MRHEKIIKDERGTIGIMVRLWTDVSFGGRDKDGNEFRYDISVWNTPPKKRSQSYVENSFATEEEIHAAKMELWNKIKP